MKTNTGSLSMNNIYTFKSVTDMGEMNFSTCDNCGRAIRYVCHLTDSNNNNYYVGTECTKTLTEANINNSYSMHEQIKEFKKISTAKNLVEKSENCRFWGYSDRSALLIIGKSGKTPKKIYITPVFDLFTGESYSFIDSFIEEIYNTKTVKIGNYAPIDYLKYFDSLKNN